MPVEQLIYTDLPRGTGVNGNLAGYQIKACSETLSADARRQLENICMHYGDAVYGAAPRAAKDRETLWRTQTESLDVMPDEVLNEFPVIWSYDRITPDEYALTRVNYCGLTHDGRFGNFFAHAIVFNTAQLEQHDFNPLALTRSTVFTNNNNGANGTTTLPRLPDLNVVTNGTGRKRSLLSQSPYRERFVALLDALCRATPDTRPVILAINDWRVAAPLIEELLDLLPPSARCRTTFATYESDRKWLPPDKEARPSNPTAAHHLLILSNSEARPANVRPDEYETSFAVFNFAENKFSESLPAPGDYAKFAAHCVSQNRLDHLRQTHQMLEELDLGRNSQAWNALVEVTSLLGEQVAVPTLANLARAFESFAQAPATAHKCLSLFLPHVRRLASNSAALEQLGPHLSTLVDRVATDVELNRTQEFVPAVFELADKAFAVGNTHVADVLLATCGTARSDILLGLLDGVLSDENAALNPGVSAPDRAATLRLLLEGLSLAQRISEFSSVRDQWLRAAFRSACAAGLAGELWTKTEEQFVKPRLAGDWDDVTEQLARDLAASTPANQSAEGSFWLNLQLLENRPPEGDALILRLRELALACSLCEKPGDRPQKLLKLALSRVSENQSEMRAEIIAQMAEAANGKPAGDIFFDAYRAELPKSDDNRFTLRHKLATAGIKHVLSRELMTEVLPWNEERLRLWRREVLSSNEQVLDCVQGALAARLSKKDSADDDELKLAEALMQDSKNTPSAGLIELYQVVARKLPLAPLSKEWGRIMKLLPEGRARVRLRLMEFMSGVERQSREPGWSIVSFAHTHTAWTEGLRELDDKDKGVALEWCLNQFAETGINTPEEAAAFVSIWSAAGSGTPEEIGKAANQLLDERDQVTKVLVIMAFARCVLDGSRQVEIYSQLVRSLLDNTDRKTRALFEEHLELRFAQRDNTYYRRLRQLCEIAKLTLPDATAQAASAQSGILGTAKRSWRKILGGAGDRIE